MTQQAAVKLLAIVQERRQIQLEEVLAYLPEFTWNQVFSLVDENSSACGGKGSDTNCESPHCPRSCCLELALFRGHCRAASAELLDTFSHIPIGWIFPSDPAIGFERFCDPTQRFQGSTENIKYLNGLLR
jgi:hypothetical protein